MAKYINADTLIDELKDTFDDGDGIAIGEYWSSKVVRSVIDDLAQDIDVRENVKGEWIGEADGYADGELVYDTWYCGACGTYFEDWEEEPTWNFCPNCGADMRGEL